MTSIISSRISYLGHDISVRYGKLPPEDDNTHNWVMVTLTREGFWFYTDPETDSKNKREITMDEY